jgi:hypothetical protein
MILNGCRLMEVEEPERNSAMQTADRLGLTKGTQLGERIRARQEHAASILRFCGFTLREL